MKIPSLLLASLLLAGCASAPPVPASVTPQSGELISNGDFSQGLKGWTVEQNGTAKGVAETVAEGPGGKPALRIQLTEASSASWHLQAYEGNLAVKKGQMYKLTFWVKSDRESTIMVNCMQNHAPWDHRNQQEVDLTKEWTKITFPFVAPWDDDNARIGFSNLATVAGQTYWFAGVSLVES